MIVTEKCLSSSVFDLVLLCFVAGKTIVLLLATKLMYAFSN